MFEFSSILDNFSNSLSQIQGAVAVPSNWIQVGMIVFSFFVGWVIRRKFAPKLSERIGRSGLNFRIRQALKNMTRLIMPTVAVFVLSFIIQLQTLEAFAWDTSVARATVKLIMVWIVIRLASQIIENSFSRQIVATTAWVIAALSIVGFLDDTVSVLESFGFSIGESRITALAVIKAIILIFALLYMAFFFAKLMDRQLAKVTSLTPSSRVLISKILRVFLITMGLLVAITSAGVDLSLLAVFGGAIGLGIGFGLQKGVSNLFSGILLLLDRSINPGDIIELQNGVFGWIDEMGARYSSVVTRDNKSFLIPNEDFITQQVINWSHGDTLVRIEIKFGVHYDSDPHLVRKLAVEAATKPERVVDEPSPVCHLSEFGDSSLDFKLRFWITDAEEGVTNVKGQVLLEIWDIFKENGVQIPYPHREIYIKRDEVA
ncbi:MAG: mechanosensitive ion channel family protein [Bdellovibrionales bacterium]